MATRGITPGTETNAGSFKASTRSEASDPSLVPDADASWSQADYDVAQDWARGLGIDIDSGNWPNPDVVGVAWMESDDPDLASLNYTVHNSLADAEKLISRITGSPRPEPGIGPVIEAARHIADEQYSGPGAVRRNMVIVKQPDGSLAVLAENTWDANGGTGQNVVPAKQLGKVLGTVMDGDGHYISNTAPEGFVVTQQYGPSGFAYTQIHDEETGADAGYVIKSPAGGTFPWAATTGGAETTTVRVESEAEGVEFLTQYTDARR